MSPGQPTVIGIDGGATHSHGALVDFEGRVLATAESGSLNFFSANTAAARENLRQLLRSLEQQHDAGGSFARCVIGSAAFFYEATAEETKLLGDGLVPLERTRVVGDCLTAYHGATLGEPGVLIVSGTGSIILARDSTGRFVHVGGWGHLVGDAGSAHWIAVEAIKTAIAALEETGTPPRLTAEIAAWFGVGQLTEIVPQLYQPAIDKEKLAALARWLHKRCGDDSSFQTVCARAGEELARQALTAARRAGLTLDPLPVYFAGGVLKHNDRVRASLTARLRAERNVEIRQPRLSPVLGAAVLALQDAGVTVNEQRLQNLAAGEKR